MSREREREEERGRDVSGGKEVGRWIPVIKNHRRQMGNKSGNKETISLFVDNIPEDRDQQWLMKTFNMFGVVKDAFVPRKRSKCTGNKFGFVRYDCRTSAGMAVSRMNGVWVDNMRLFVKEACFGQDKVRLNQKVPRFSVAEKQVPNQERSPSLK